MRRHQACACIGFVVSLIVAGCGGPRLPVQPTEAPVEPLLPAFSISGRVVDTAYRPLGGSKVEIVNGPAAGTVEITDEAGRFRIPTTFTQIVALVASKDGYVSEARSIPPRNIPLFRLIEGATWDMQFYLAPIGPPADVVGVYSLTLTAAQACTSLPADVRTRTYTATIVGEGRSGSFLAELSGARFHSLVPCPLGRSPETCTFNRFGLGIAADYASIGIGFVERLGDTNYLMFEAGAEGSFGPSGITAPLDGRFEYCPSEPILVDQGTWACPGNAGIGCESHGHQLALVRR